LEKVEILCKFKKIKRKGRYFEKKKIFIKKRYFELKKDILVKISGIFCKLKKEKRKGGRFFLNLSYK